MRLLFMGFPCLHPLRIICLFTAIHATCCNLLEYATHSCIQHHPFGLRPTYLTSVELLETSNRASHRSPLQLLPYPVCHGRNEKHNLAGFRLGMGANGRKSGTTVHTRTADSTETLAPGRRMGAYLSQRRTFRTVIVLFHSSS